MSFIGFKIIDGVIGMESEIYSLAIAVRNGLASMPLPSYGIWKQRPVKTPSGIAF